VATATRLEDGGILWLPEPGRLTAQKVREVGNARELAPFFWRRGDKVGATQAREGCASMVGSTGHASPRGPEGRERVSLRLF
jgi:hypothetical protein